MSTEAMLKLAEEAGFIPELIYDAEGRFTRYSEELIKAALDAAVEKCQSEHAGWQEIGYGRSVAKRIADIIRQITPQQVMEKMK